MPGPFDFAAMAKMLSPVRNVGGPLSYMAPPAGLDPHANMAPRPQLDPHAGQPMPPHSGPVTWSQQQIDALSPADREIVLQYLGKR